jgi:hypothetical protein
MTTNNDYSGVQNSVVRLVTPISTNQGFEPHITTKAGYYTKNSLIFNLTFIAILPFLNINRQVATDAQAIKPYIKPKQTEFN